MAVKAYVKTGNLPDVHGISRTYSLEYGMQRFLTDDEIKGRKKYPKQEEAKTDSNFGQESISD